MKAKMYGFESDESLEFLAWAYNYYQGLKAIKNQHDDLRYESSQASEFIVNLRNEIEYFRKILFLNIKTGRWRNKRSQLITSRILQSKYRARLITILMNE